VRIEVLGRNGRAKQAVAESRAWLEAHPGRLHGRLLLAAARELAGDVDGSLADLRRAVAEAPDSLAPHVLLARAYQKAGRLEEAEAAWTAGYARFPTNDALAFDLALSREKIGDLPGAEAAVRDVLRREPDNAPALNFLGYLFADHNMNLDEALVMIRRAIELDPENGAYIDSMGWVLYRLGRLAEARTHLERALRLTGGDPVIHEHLGDVYNDLKLKDLAREQYRLSLAAEANDRVKAKLSGLR
jgi:tetratricopeptide (TPR) repeat protein